LKIRGVEVTVACPDESQILGLIGHIRLGSAKYTFQQDLDSAEKSAFRKYEEALGQFDIIHDMTWYGWSYRAKAINPGLRLTHTHHGHLAWKTAPIITHMNFVAISRFMQAEYAKLGVPAKCVYNGIPLDDYPFSDRHGDRLLYVGRITKFKQPHVAIGLARLTGVPLDIIGGDRFVQDPAYVSLVKGSCDGDTVRYLGEVPPEVKLQHLQRCRSVVIPSAWGEPFGLAAVEAMATGAPVICLKDGALSELVEHGETGFICESPAQMVEVIKNGLDQNLKPESCRRRAEQFSRESMAERYIELYSELMQGHEW
jgi:glycosyltransferase involved in cell wall biosynthesis